MPLGRVARELSRSTDLRLDRLHRFTSWADQEANAVGLKLIKETHDILNIIKPPEESINNLPYTGIPFARNLSVFERSEQLKRLTTLLHPHDASLRPHGILTASLVGPGGQGKTQVAIEYLHRYSHFYDAIVWCAADSSLTLAESFASYARSIGIVAQSSVLKDEQHIAFFKHWLVQVFRRSESILKAERLVPPYIT